MKRKTTIILFVGLFNWLLVAAQSGTPSKDSVSNDPGVVLMTQANAAFDKADYDASARMLYQQLLACLKHLQTQKAPLMRYTIWHVRQ